jgi:hypothetical protein
MRSILIAFESQLFESGQRKPADCADEENNFLPHNELRRHGGLACRVLYSGSWISAVTI